MIPVSYTHLDVYKGQVMDRTRILMASRDKSYFMDGGKLEVEKDKVLKQLEQLHKLLRRQQDNCQTYFQDMEFLHSFIPVSYTHLSPGARFSILLTRFIFSSMT